MRGAGLAAAAHRVFCPPSSLIPLSHGITGQWLSRLLNTYHFKDCGSLLFTFSVIHTWTTQSHNWSAWLGGIFHSINLYVLICCKRSQIREFVHWGLRLYSGLSPSKGSFLMSGDKRHRQWKRVFFLWPSGVLWYSIPYKDGLERPADSLILLGLISTAVEHI